MRKLRRDRQLAEFEQGDLGRDVRRSRSALHVRSRSRPTSILLPEPLVQRLRAKAAKRGIGYQTMMKIILTEQLRRY
ncbi:MAG: hypothetical protein HYV03_01525 [Deltaproteobacteria bacterium]|nr:hypothetical protein [Deltaproteobacteria bacterium]